MMDAEERGVYVRAHILLRVENGNRQSKYGGEAHLNHPDCGCRSSPDGDRGLFGRQQVVSRSSAGRQPIQAAFL